MEAEAISKCMRRIPKDSNVLGCYLCQSTSVKVLKGLENDHFFTFDHSIYWCSVTTYKKASWLESKQLKSLLDCVG